MARPTRLNGFDYIGPYRYFLTYCTYARREIFRDVSFGCDVVSHFRRIARQRDFAIFAYCLMPDHAHLLVEGTSGSADLRQFVKQMKQRTGQVYWRRFKRHLWQEGYHDRVLRVDEESIVVARYIIENPVRAGLVTSPLDYPLLGSEAWSVQEILDSI